MKVLVIGGGGREHALAWKLAQSAKVQAVFVAPGNAGTAAEPRLKNVAITDLDELADFALAEKIDLTVVGPEAALAAGAVDIFRARGLRIFGPTQAAAAARKLEGVREGVHAAARDPDRGLRGLRRRRGGACARRRGEALPIVVKADGLAAGKGVVVAATPRRSARRDRRDARPRRRGGRQPRRHRGIPRRRGGELHGRLRRPRRACRSRPARTTSASATATAARTPAAWAPIRRRRW